MNLFRGWITSKMEENHLQWVSVIAKGFKDFWQYLVSKRQIWEKSSLNSTKVKEISYKLKLSQNTTPCCEKHSSGLEKHNLSKAEA